MAQPFPIVNLPAGLKLPGVYTSIVLNSDGGAAAPNNRCLIWAYMSAGGLAPPNTPFQALNKSQVDNMCKSYSMAAHAYAAAKSALPDGIGAEFWIVPLVEPSGGTAQAKKVVFLGMPTTAGVTSTATTASAADTCTITYRGRGTSFGIKSGDTWATIASNAKTALELIPDLPFTIGISTATLTFTSRHKGAFDDGAVQVDFANQAGSLCAASPGTLTFASAAGASGTATYNLGVQTTTSAITNGDAATVSAGGAITAINADAYCVTASQLASPDGVVILYYVTGRPCRAISTSLASVTTQTLTCACDTAGAGVPSVSSSLTKLTADENSYKAWSLFFTDTSNVGSVATTIEAQEAVGTLEKGQMAYIVLADKNITTLASLTLATSTTPALTSSARYGVGWQQGSPQAGWELAARVAAVVAASGYVAQNFNGTRLVTNAAVPLGVPHKADRASRDDMNTAIASYYHFPIGVDSGGYNAIVRSNSTYKAQGINDRALEKWSCRLTLDFFRADLRAFLSGRFGTKSIKNVSDPRTTNTVKPLGVKAAVYECCKRWDDADLFDGADAVRDAIMAGVVVSPNRIDIAAPFRTVKDIDQIVVAGIQE